MKLVAIVGTRPNFVKLAAVSRQCKEDSVDLKIIHTGQHFDQVMSEVFFRDLEIPKPDVNLGISGGRFEDQMGRQISEISKALEQMSDRWVLVMGDSVPVAAGTIAAKARQMPVIHLEAGLRSQNRLMPEETNRMIADALADVWLVSERSGMENLKNDGINDRVCLVGNVMIDTLTANLDKIKKEPGLGEKYALCTLHRAENVDDYKKLSGLMEMVNKIANKYMRVVFAIHPRTKLRIEQGEIKIDKRVEVLDPLPYLQMQKAQSEATFIVTDSGGVQEESTWWGVPCLTLREDTERPITIEEGTNTLIGGNYQLLEEKVDEILAGSYKKGKVPKFWDGKAAKRVIENLMEIESKYSFEKNGLVRI